MEYTNLKLMYLISTKSNDLVSTVYFEGVSSAAALDTNILQLTAEDADGQNVLTYSMAASSQFVVQPSSGMITNKALLGREAGKTYTFEVTVTDGATTDTAQVEVSGGSIPQSCQSKFVLE